MDIILAKKYFQWRTLTNIWSRKSTFLNNIRCLTEKFTNALDTTNQTRGEHCGKSQRELQQPVISVTAPFANSAKNSGAFMK